MAEISEGRVFAVAEGSGRADKDLGMLDVFSALEEVEAKEEKIMIEVPLLYA